MQTEHHSKVAATVPPPVASSKGSLVAVVGPPAVGKSTVTATTAHVLDAEVFRLRDYADWYQRSHPELSHLFTTDDQLGWLRDSTVATLLGNAIGDPNRPRTLLLENLPGTAAQLGCLIDLAAEHAVRLHIVELTAPDSVLAARASARRVCPGCEPDLRGDPHRPARAQKTMPDLCARCGGQLVPRRSDAPDLFASRLLRYRTAFAHVRAAAQIAGLSHHVVDAARDPITVKQEFLVVCSPISTIAPQGASR